MPPALTSPAMKQNGRKPKYVKVTEAARLLGVSRVKVSALLKEGTLTFITDPLDSRVKLIREDDLLNLKERSPRAA
jgi:excisionase family DNA binding protein